MRTRCSKGASFLGTAAVGLAVSASLCGCGGASPGPGATSSASGRVTLPPGTSLSAVDLTISSSSDDAPVGVDGRFTVAEPPGGGPATVTATDAQGRLVMLGHVDTDNPAFNDVSPTSTAQELLFFSTLSFVLPQDQWPGVYDILAAAPETATLAQVISARIAANPTALADLDAELLAALDAATVSLLPATGAAASIIAPLASSDAPASRSSAVVTETGKAVSVLVKSANPYGLEVLDSLDDLGVFIRNTARIHRFWAVYRTGFVPVTGKSTDPPIALPAWVQVGGGFQSGTTGATGVIGSLIDYFVGKVAWAPKVTPTIPLPMDPPDAKANSFRVFVVGAGAGGLAVPADLAGQPTFATKLADQAKLVVLFEIAKELVWPIVTKAVPAKSIGKLLNDPGQWTTFITQLSYELGTAGLNIDQYVASGDIKDALSAILKAMAGNKLVREAIFKAAQDQLKTLGVNAAGSSVWPDSRTSARAASMAE